MDRGERLNSFNPTLLAALQGQQADLWTALPGIIQSFDPVAMTCVVQPAIQARVESAKTGQFSWVTLPLLLDCPVHFPCGGGYTLTFPIVNGDECLVVFASRCIDSWWYAGGIQKQHQIRMHDLSDGFVFVGVRSQPRVLPNVSTNSTQLRNDAGDTYVELQGTTINIITPGITNVNTGGDTNVTAGGKVAVISGGDTTVNASAKVSVVSSGDTSVTAGGNAKVEAAGSATVKAPSIVLKNAGAALKKLCNEAFVTFFNGHQHNFSYSGTADIITGAYAGSGTTGTPTSSAGSGQLTSVVQAE